MQDWKEIEGSSRFTSRQKRIMTLLDDADNGYSISKAGLMARHEVMQEIQDLLTKEFLGK